MRLKELIDKLEIEYTAGDLDVEIKGISYDSRKVSKEYLFVAIEGFKTDGHNYIEDAVKNGAVAVVIEKDVKINKDIAVVKVKNSRVALAKIASIFYDEPSYKINLIGVTGTNAKTTTTYLVKSIFESNGEKAGVIGTIGSVIGEEVEKTLNTTPESLDLQRYFDLMVKSGIDNCIMEVSSHSLELNRVAFCDFNVGIFTNLTVDHLDFHRNIDNYLNAKLKLFYKTKSYNIINIDDPYGKKIIDKIKGLSTPLLTYGIEEKADITAKEIKYYATGVSFILVTPKGEIEINMNIPGLFSVYNGLAAAACGYVHNIELEYIKKGLESTKGVRGRFEVVPTGMDFTVIIDFAHTPDGLEKVLKTIDQFAKGRKIVLFGLGGERDKSKRPVMGEIAAKYADFCIVTSDNPRSENPEDIIEDIVKGIENKKGNYIVIVDRKEAIKYAIENSKPKDVILLAGKGHENYQIIGDKIIPFNEREIVLELLSKRKI